MTRLRTQKDLTTTELRELHEEARQLRTDPSLSWNDRFDAAVAAVAISVELASRGELEAQRDG